MKIITKPKPEIIPSFYQSYLAKVPDDGALLIHLQEILDETVQLVSGLPEEKVLFRYADGKWTIKDILVHLSDCERVIIYRAMRICRSDKTNLPGFDENAFVINAEANDRSVDFIIAELKAARNASIAFIATLNDESLDQIGMANGYPISGRLLVNHLYGHHRHHLLMIQKYYL